MGKGGRARLPDPGPARKRLREASTDPTVGVLIAGGPSRRFGTGKMAFEIDGRSILARTAAAFEGVTPRLMVSVHTPSQASTFRRLLPSSASFVVDRPGTGIRGPALGMVTAIPEIRGRSFLVVAGDMPWLQTSALSALWEVVRSERLAVASPLRESGLVESLVQVHRVPLAPGRLSRLLRDRVGFLRPTDFLRATPGLGLVAMGNLSRDPRCFLSVNARADLEMAQPRGGIPGSGPTVRVPGSACRRFWEATTSLSRGEHVEAARAYADESVVYHDASILHLELHCLADSGRCLRRAGRSTKRVRQQIARLKQQLPALSQR